MAKLLLLAIALALIATASAKVVRTEKILPPNFPKPMEILQKIQIHKSDGKSGPIFEVDFGDWMDGFFEAYEKVFEFNGWDNIKLHLNVTNNFEREFNGVIHQGQMTMYDKFISGAQTLHRTGESKLVIDYVEDGRDVGDHIYFRLTGQLGFDFLTWNNKLYIDWMNLNANPSVQASIKDVGINFAGRIRSDCQMALESQDVTIGSTEIDITEVEGPIGDIVDFLADLVEIGVKQGLHTMTETIIRWIWEDIEDLFKHHSVICDDTCPQKEHLVKPHFEDYFKSFSK